jgi:hypothetical protein
MVEKLPYSTRLHQYSQVSHLRQNPLTHFPRCRAKRRLKHRPTLLPFIPTRMNSQTAPEAQNVGMALDNINKHTPLNQRVQGSSPCAPTIELVVAGIALRRMRTKVARAALVRVGRAARQAGIPAPIGEVESASFLLSTPAARLIARGEEQLLLLEEVEAVLVSGALVVDACRHVLRDTDTAVSLAKRPVLFALARALREASPSRDTLVKRAFRAKHADETHRARLRGEIGRLRAELRSLASVSATTQGFALAAFCGGSRRAGAVAVKLGLQAIATTAPDLPPEPGVHATFRARARI